MNYLGFLCLGLGLLSLISGMICGLVAIVSHEPPIKRQAKRVATLLLPLAVLLLTTGIQLTFAILFPKE